MGNMKEPTLENVHQNVAPVNYRLVVQQRNDEMVLRPWGVDYLRGNIRISIRNFSMVGGLAGLIQSFMGIAIMTYLMQCHRYKDDIVTISMDPYWNVFFDILQNDPLILIMIVTHLLLALIWFAASLFMLTNLVFPKRTRNDAIKFSYSIAFWTTVTSLVCAWDIICCGLLFMKAMKYLSFFISEELDYCIAKSTLRRITVLLIMSGSSCRFVVPWLINACCAFALCFASFQSATTLKL